jgi:dolichol-phosphate mannosyltransferase
MARPKPESVPQDGLLQLPIVIPVFNEEDCIGPLLREIAAKTQDLPVLEVIVVDDGSSDATAQAVLAEKGATKGLRLISHKSRRGQSTATLTGISRANGDLIVTLDGDGQNDPGDIRLLFEAYRSAADPLGPRILVAGQRKKRRDTALRRVSSRVANTVRAWILDDGVRDTGCSLKLFRRSDFVALPFFNHIHRFIPALMKATGVRLVLVDVSHRPRERGTSKYGMWDRLWVGIHDLVGVSWLISRITADVEVEEK